MNNLVFSTVADQLKTVVYGQDGSGVSHPLKVDASDNLVVLVDGGTVTIGNASLTVAGTVTVSQITAAVTIGNASLTVGGTVTVSQITAAVTIGNASLTVAGSVTVAGTVTVSEITSAVTIGNASLTVAGSVTVAGTVTVSQITSAVTIGNASLTVAGSVTVAGTVTVSEITSAVTIGNASLTVAGSVTVAGTVTVSQITSAVTIGNASLTVAGTVTVSQITAAVTIGNASLTVSVAGNQLTETSALNQPVTGTGEIFDDFDISQFRTGTIFLYNLGATPITISLQISPVNDTTHYQDDPNYTDQVLGASGSATGSLFMVLGNYAHYARLQYDMGGANGTLDAYLNAQA